MPMNKRPVSYLQVDARWKNKPYRVTGEQSTIGSAGCGPTCAAMVIATLADKSVTPVETCAWAVRRGFKALNQGTYYSYFAPQLAAYGIDCRQLLGSRIISQPSHTVVPNSSTTPIGGCSAVSSFRPESTTR